MRFFPRGGVRLDFGKWVCWRVFSTGVRHLGELAVKTANKAVRINGSLLECVEIYYPVPDYRWSSLFAERTMAVSLQTCANHPDRPGRAVCMTCKKTVCAECATQWDGINYCVSCLKKTSDSSRERSSFFSYAAMLLAGAFFFFIGAYAMIWSLVLMARIK